MAHQPLQPVGKRKTPGEAEVLETFMATLEHPLKKEINEVRKIIKEAAPQLKEHFKWSAPSYYDQADLVTFNLRPHDKIHLVFHNIHIVQVKSTLLEGTYKDRRMTYFSGMNDIQAKKIELQRIIREYVERACANNV